ncbi:hypothetical protein pneo_cds_325 [Pandoravirus neocaledonia]|uniref:C962R-like N-terminal AEP domain-containing protein n=1 Tax=Pandoravirus neocaledonia TaxID=2107708 RepID=A0A2U7UC15_9VIRU|nr:hypothetical protein pneo_cds_325 [Pandoravirus neocaledonia]AVK75932.1 hypothetical protein pneo_cds_325 [Pandoravirus neocaledonia]
MDATFAGIMRMSGKASPTADSAHDPLQALVDARGVRPSPVNMAIAAVIERGADAPSESPASAPSPAAAPSDMHRRFDKPDPQCVSALKTFLARGGFLVKKAARKAGASEPAPPPTTALLKDGWGGGVLSVPDDDYDAFLEAYADDVDHGIKHAVCEQRSAVFRMYLDIDLTVPRAASRRAVLTLARLLQHITGSFFPDADAEARRTLLAMVVFAAQEKALPNGRGVKQGIHIVMPNLFVTWRQALDMRETYLTLLKRAYGPDARAWAAGKKGRDDAPPTDVNRAEAADAADCTWEKVIDHNVYTFNGLRMPFSHNVLKCPVCKGARTRPGVVPCVGPCNGTGKCWEARWYEPAMCLDGAGAEDPLTLEHMGKNVRACLKRTSIRCRASQPASPGWTHFAGAPRCDIGTLDPKWEAHVKRIESGGGHASATGTRASSNTVAPDDPRFVRMVSLLRAKAHAPHARVDVRTIRHDVRGNNYYIVEVDGEGSCACLNMPSPPGSDALCGEHDNARIFYQLSRAGLVQKCHCRCPHDGMPRRLYTTCRNFKSAVVPISDEDRALFFGSRASTGGNGRSGAADRGAAIYHGALTTALGVAVGHAGATPQRAPPTLFSARTDKPDAAGARIATMMKSFRSSSISSSNNGSNGAGAHPVATAMHVGRGQGGAVAVAPAPLPPLSKRARHDDA